MVHSYSSLECFKQCPLKFKNMYLKRTKKGSYVEGAPAFLGRRVHESMEKLYKDIMSMKKDSLEEIIGYYSYVWDNKWADRIILPKKNLTAKDYKEKGVKFITDYYNRFEPFNRDKTIGVEKRISFKLGKKKHKLVGIIDRLAIKDGYYEVHDYKTNAFMPKEKELKKNWQLALYSIGIMQMYPNIMKTKQIWHYMAFDEDVVMEKSKKELKQLENETVNLINKIENYKKINNFPATPNRLCDWCGYKKPCPEYKN